MPDPRVEVTETTWAPGLAKESARLLMQLLFRPGESERGEGERGEAEEREAA